MDSPACGLGYCEDCGIDCGVRDRDDDAAIETLRVMLLRTASERAGFARWLGDGPGDATTVGGRACIAIALALLL